MPKKKAKKAESARKLFPDCASSVFMASAIWSAPCPSCGVYIAKGELDSHIEWCKTLSKKVIKRIQEGELYGKEVKRMHWRYLMGLAKGIDIDEPQREWRSISEAVACTGSGEG